MPPFDTQLAHRAIAGDKDAFGLLTQQYWPLVFGEIQRQVRSADQAADLAQDVFCKAFERVHTLRHAECFVGWLKRMAVNTAISWGRQNARHRRLLDQCWPPEDADQAPSPIEFYERQKHHHRLRTQMALLPPTERRALVLYYDENCSYAQISRAMGICQATVKWHLRQGRQRLRRQWERSPLQRGKNGI